MVDQSEPQQNATPEDTPDKKGKGRGKRLLIVAGAVIGLLIVCCVGITLLPSSTPTETPTAALVEAETAASDTDVPAKVDTATEGPTNTPAATSTPMPTNTPRPTPTKEVGTASNPIPVGQWGSFTQGGILSDQVEFRLMVEDTIRGQAAWDKIYIANIFNDKPEDGYEWMLIQINVEDLGPDPESTLELNDYDFTMRTGGRIFEVYDHSVCCLDEVKIKQLDSVKLVQGGSYEGWIAFQVAVDDPDPLLALGEKFYFSTAAE